jgi:hypothetical protein
MPIQTIDQPITLSDLAKIANERFGDLVKAVIDVERGVMSVGAEMHSDSEEILLEDGSKQRNLWGINLYPQKTEEEFIEFDSMINLRVSQGNSTRGVDDPATRQKIIEIVSNLVRKS